MGSYSCGVVRYSVVGETTDGLRVDTFKSYNSGPGMRGNKKATVVAKK